VTNERKPYPSFAPEDFPAVYKASQGALKKAQLRAMQDTSQQVGPTTLHRGCIFPLTLELLLSSASDSVMPCVTVIPDILQTPTTGFLMKAFLTALFQL
jgi:hypothetical protein